MPSPLKRSSYDVIVCGGGTAGCVIAARLTEDPSLHVLLLEAGENANDDFRISTPGLFPLVVDNPERDWQYMSEASPGLNGRQIGFARGKCLGGSSAINLMALIYPSKTGMDTWAELGNKGWDWDGLAPYYRKFQAHIPPSADVKEALGLEYLDPALQGVDGPIKSSFPAAVDPMQNAWIDTWKGLQKHVKGDPLSGLANGGHATPASVDPATGTRSHSGTAYLQPVIARKNLEVITNALIEKVQLDRQDGGEVEATGVTFSQNGERHSAKASKEVIISAGVFGSPQILELSGIGSAKLHQELGIANVINNPNVGDNMQDHLMCGPSFEVVDGVATADVMRDPAVIQQVMAQYQKDHTGPLSQGAGYSFAYTPLTDFLSPDPKDELNELFKKYEPSTAESNFKAQNRHYAFCRRIIESPDEASNSLCFFCVQFHGEGKTPTDVFSLSEPGNYTTILTQLSHPFSRGRTHITSADPTAHPKIEPNFLSHELDVEILARHLMQVETLAQTAPLKDFLKPSGRRLPKGHDAFTLENAKAFVRAASTSNYHPSGTCAMMPLDLGGVVDERLKVHGTKNLRVIDASIFPIEPRGNIQSTVYAVAEKGADLVKEDLSACAST